MEINFLHTVSQNDIESLPEKTCAVVNLQKVNDIRWVDRFFETVNIRLPAGGFFISCAEIYSQRKKRIENKYPKMIANLYLGLSFIFNRVLPRINPTKQFHKYLTKGNNRVMSKAEVFGRLAAAGFEILKYDYINNLLYFTAKKIGNPVYKLYATYGFFIKLKRIGKDGNKITVYKIRTMHPYSEYLQEYIYKNNSVERGGKFNNDFRIASWGKIFRKLWIDEIPMMINFIKGELKLVGIRPLSSQYFTLYPPIYRVRRIKYKPGLIPPCYADCPGTIEEVIASEIKYLDSYDRAPLLTDIKYFFNVLHNIVFKNVRSK